MLFNYLVDVLNALKAQQPRNQETEDKIDQILMVHNKIAGL